MGKTKAKKAPDNTDLSVLGNLCPDISSVLNKCSYGNSFEKLTGKEYEELWSNLFLEMLKYLSCSEQESQLFINQSVVLIDKACAYDAVKASNSPTIIKMLSALNEESMESCSNDEIRNRICKLNESWLAKKDLPAVKRMDVFTFRHLLGLVTAVEKPSAADIKRLCAFGVHVNAALQNTHIPIIKKLVYHPVFLASEAGQKFLGRMASLSEHIFVEAFMSINLELSDCTKDIAVAYGKILMMAWCHADIELKETIQRRLQSLMEEFIRVLRTKLELPKRSKNGIAMIDEWNIEVRKKAKDDFTKMITDCYQPILWKYLTTGKPWERCNAANLFLKAFPLSIPGDADASNELFNKQVERMESALRDDCWIVRVIAIREILNILPVYWSEFTPVQIQKLITIITKEDAADTSTPEVRRTVWRGLVNLVKHKQGLQYLKVIIPSLGDYIRDNNAGVRKAFINLLIAIREEESTPLSDLIDVDSCFLSLMHENQDVGWLIVKLLIPNVYQEEMTTSQWIMNLCKLIYKYPHAYRNFFMFSKNVLPFEKAEFIMAEILHCLGKHVITKAVPLDDDDDDDDDEDDDDTENQTPKAATNQSNRSGSINSTVNSEKGGRTAFDNPRLVIGLFDIVAILWSIHSVKIDEKAREEIKKRKLNTRHRNGNEDIMHTLHDVYVSYVPRFVSYYKGSEIFNSVVSLCGNIPTRLLTSNSITLPGRCMKKLKTMKANSDEDFVALVALVKWGMGDQILEQVTLWLESTFAAANDTALGNKSKKVKISEDNEPNSLMAIDILDRIFGAEPTQVHMFTKYHGIILELWKMMSAIMRLISRRLLRKTPFSNGLLSDEFLLACFSRYVRLIPLLHKAPPQPASGSEDGDESTSPNPADSFDSKVELWSLIQWTQDDIVPYLQSEKADCPDLQLIASIVNQVLFVSDNMVSIHLADTSFYTKFVDFSMSLLNCEYNLHFLKGVSRLATAMSYASHQKRRMGEVVSPQIFSNMIPSLVFHIYNALVSRARPKHEFTPFLQDFNTTENNTLKILLTYKLYFENGKQTRSELDPMNLMTSKALNALRVEIAREVPREDQTVPFYSSLACLPAAARVVIAPYYKSDFWTSFFLVILKKYLGTTVKILLIDIIIIYLFGTKPSRKKQPIFKEVVKAAVEKLKKFKSPQESGATHIHGLTLSRVEEEKEANSEDENEDVPTQELPRVRNIGSEGSVSRDSAPSNMATVGTLATLTVDGSRPSEVTETAMISQAPSSQQTAMDSEIPISQPGTSSQPPSGDFESQQLMSTQQVFTQMTVGSSQPVSSQQATVGSSQPQSSQPDEDDDFESPEHDLLQDFILVGEELLKNLINELK